MVSPTILMLSVLSTPWQKPTHCHSATSWAVRRVTCNSATGRPPAAPLRAPPNQLCPLSRSRSAVTPKGPDPVSCQLTLSRGENIRGQLRRKEYFG